MAKRGWQGAPDRKQQQLGLAIALAGLSGGWVVETRHAATLGDLARLGRDARPAPLDRLDPGLEGQAVHAVGTVTSARLVDDLGVVVEALRLEREVRMLCWKQVKEEYEDSDGKTRTRSVCARVWSEEPGDCCWSHTNPHMPVRSAAYVAEGARLGPYRLSRAVAAAAPLRKLLPATPPHLATLKLTQVGEGWRHGDPRKAEVGDLQLEYRAATPPPARGVAEVELTYTVLAAQRGDALVPWPRPGGGDGLVLVAPGRVSVEALVGAAVRATKPPWAWRVGLLAAAVVGAVLIVGGFDLDWRHGAGFFVVVGAAALAPALLVAGAVWRDGSLGLAGGGAALGAAVVGRLATRRRPPSA